MLMRSDLSDLYLSYLPNLRRVTMGDYKDWELEYPKIFTVMSTDNTFENFTGVGGLGLLTQKDEGVDIDTDSPIQLYDKKLTPVKYGLAVEHTFEVMDDDKHGVVVKQGRLLARSARQSEEILAAAILDGSHDTYTSADASYIHATDHPIDGGATTASNILAAATDLSITGIEAALNQLESTVDDRGLQIMDIGRKLVINSQDQFSAHQLIRSTDDPTTADRATNSLGSYPLTIQMMHYLTDTDAWYIWGDLADVEDGWIFLRRKAFALGHDVNERNQTAITVGTERFTLGVIGWRGSIKSLGTA